MVFITGLMAGIILTMAGVITIGLKENEKLEQRIEHEKYQEGKHAQKNNATRIKGT